LGTTESVAGLVVGSGSSLILGDGAGFNVGGAAIVYGDVAVESNSTLTIGGDLDNYGHFEVTDPSSVTIVGNLINSGLLGASDSTLTVDGSVNNTDAFIYATLGGAVTLEGDVNNTDGEIYVDVSSSLTIEGNLNNPEGYLNVGGMLTIAGAVTGGNATIDGGALTIDGNAGLGSTTFDAGVTGTLVLGQNTGSAGGTIQNFGDVEYVQGGQPYEPDVIDFAGVQFNDNAQFTFNSATDQLTVSDTAGDSVTVAFAAGDQLFQPNFVLGEDESGGTTVTFIPVPDTWTSSTSADWSTASDWDFGVAPTAGLDALISVAGTYTVSISSDVDANSLTVNNADATVDDNTDQLYLNGALDLEAGIFNLQYGSVLAQTVTVASGAAFAGSGTVENSSNFDNEGTVTAAGGVLEIEGAVTGGGNFVIGDGATLGLGGSDISDSAFTGTVSFAGSSGELQFKPSENGFGGTIADFGGNDLINLTDFYGQGSTATWTQGYDGNLNAGTLTLSGLATSTGSPATESLVLDGTYSTADFSLQPDPNDGSLDVLFNIPLSGAGLSGVIVTNFTGSSVNDGVGLTPDATFTATDINYGPNTDSLAQFLDNNGQTDGNTISNSVGSDGVQSVYIQMNGYILLTGGTTYNFTSGSDDGSVLSIDGQTVVDNDFPQGFPGNAPNGIMPITPAATGYYPIEIQYFQGGGGAQLLAQYSTDGGDTYTDLTSPVLYQAPLQADSGNAATMNFTDGDPNSTVTITGLPDDLSNFNAGTYAPGSQPDTGTWTGTAAGFNSLSFTTGAAGVYTLSIAASDGAATTTVSDTLVVAPDPVAANVTIANVTGPTSGGWSLDPENGHYYKFVNTTTDWYSAESAALADDGAYLATITAGAENVFVAQQIPTDATAWTGGESTQDSTSGDPATANAATFYWRDGPEAGALFSYAGWNNDGLPPGGGEPTGWSTTSVEALQVGSNVQWNDVPDYFNSGYSYVEEWGGLPNQVAFTENTTTELTAAQLLAADSGNNLSLIAVSATSTNGGTVTLDDGIITYTPGVDESGADSFTYTITDGTTQSTGTVSFDVAAVPTLEWSGGGGTWDSTNWTPNAATSDSTPAGTDDATVNATGAAYTMTIGGTDAAQTLTVDSVDATVIGTGSLALGGGLEIDAGTFALQGGSLSALSIDVASGASFSGYGTVTSPIAVTGTITASGGTLDFQNFVTGDAAFTIEAGATLEFDGVTSTGPTVSFGADTGTLVLAQPDSFQGQIANVSGSDVLDLQGLSAANGDTFEASASAGVAEGTTLLTVTDQTRSTSAFVTLVGDYTNTAWSLAADGQGGINVSEAPPPPPPIDTWAGTTGDLTDGNQWSFGSPPANGAAAIIDSGGNPQLNTTVTFDGNTLQNGGEIDIGVTSGAILTLVDGTTIAGGSLVIGDGQSGELKIEANGTNTAGATLDDVAVTNNGTIQVDPSGTISSPVDLILSDGTIVTDGTLSIGGTGEVQIASGSNGPGATLHDVSVENSGTIEVATGATLTLNDHTTVSGGNLTLDDTSSTLDIDGTATLDGVTVNNAGALRIDGGSYSTTLADTVTLQGGGTLTLEAGTQIDGAKDVDGNPAQFDNVNNTITGTGIIGDGSGDMALTNEGTIDATGGMLIISTGSGGNTFTNSGLLEATDGGTLNVRDVEIDNSGTGPDAGILVDGTSTLMVGNSSLELTGGGTVTLEAGSQFVGTSSSYAASLYNFSGTIQGAGTIGAGIGLQNDADGTIDAAGGTLTIDTGNTVENAGLMEATTGTLQIDDNVDNTNTVEANGGAVIVSATGSLSGGTVEIAGGGLFEFVDSTAEDVTFAGASAGILEVRQAPYSGTISGFGSGDLIDLTGITYGSDEAAVFTGGVLTISDDGTPQTTINFSGTYTSADFSVTPDSPSSGAGTEVVWADAWTGDGNDGNWFDASNWSSGVVPGSNEQAQIEAADTITFSSNSPGYSNVHCIIGSLVLATGATLDIVDTTLIVVAEGSAISGTVDLAASGTLQFDSSATLENGATISGGTLTIESGSTVGFDGVGNGSPVLDGVTVNNSGLLQVDDNTTLFIANTVTLQGSGSVELSATPGYSSMIVGDNSTAGVLDNVDNTISGVGQIGTPDYGQVTLINETGGTIDADVSDQSLTVTPATITNEGLMEATDGGALNIEISVIDNDNGTIAAYAGSSVGIYDATINGGTVTTAAAAGLTSAGLFSADGTSAINDATIDNYGSFEIGGAPSSTVTLDDVTVTNAGNIQLDPDAILVLAGTTSVSGSGTIDISGGTFNDQSTGTLSDNITFTGSAGTFAVSNPADFAGAVSGIAAGDDNLILDLGGFTAGSNDTFTVTPTQNGGDTILLVTDISQSPTDSESITLVGNETTGNGFSWTATADGSGGANVFDPVTAAATIAAGASLALSAPSNETVTFAGGTGSLVLNDPDGFTGQIVGFTGTAPDAAHSDTIDLVGINYDSALFANSYNSTTGLLTVTDGTNTAHISFDDFNATLDFASDGDGGTLVTDPPAAGSSATSGAAASAPVEWGMKFDNDKIDLDLGQPKDHNDGAVGAAGADNPKDVLVSLHNDNFVFHQDLGAETGLAVAHFDGDELSNSHPNAQLAEHLAALVTPDPHHDGLNGLVHNDAVAANAVTQAQWHEHLTNAFHLH
jgi:hypothetical protein